MKQLLAKLGWSQSFFATHVGVSEKTVNRWCFENPNPVAMKYLQLICRLLGV